MATLRHKIAQMLIMGFSGTEINATNPVRHWLTVESIGGVLLFDVDVATRRQGKNLINRQQIIHLNNQLKTIACQNKEDNSILPLFIAIDYEGGYVDRLKEINGCMVTLTPSQLATLSESELSLQAEQMAATLESLGFNVNFAPVVDLNVTSNAGIIGKLGRSFSSEASQVVSVARQFVKAFNEKGITCCFKHFPGHGSATGDTHSGFTDVTSTFQPEEIEPYYSLATSNESMIMTAHVINQQLDPSGLPATLSHTILTKLLREKIGFDGVIISDDLQMKAISDHYSLEQALFLTINAGADMLIFANQLDTISATTVIDSIEALVKSEQINEARINEAYARIVRLKQMQMISSPLVLEDSNI